MKEDTPSLGLDPAGRDQSSRRNASVGGLLRAAGDFIAESLTLLMLEGRLAVVSLIVMAAAAIAAAVLAVSAWLTGLAALAVWLTGAGLSWELVLLSIAVANAALGVVCGVLIQRLSRNLLFPATRRSLQPHSTNPADDAQVDTP